MTEEWRPVIGWEGLYEVSDLGRVRSLPRRVIGGGYGGEAIRGGRMLNPIVDTGDYRFVALSNGGKRKLSVHSLVAAAFIGPRPTPKHEVRHLDGDPSNNTLANLAYGTGAENWDDRRRHGRGAFALARGACTHGHAWTEANTYIHPRNGTPTCRTCRREGMRRRYQS